jgi:YidC/Oxa1 family membrane protein insertase
MKEFFSTIISEPLYNGLVYLMSLLPFLDAGVIIIIFTIIIKLILLPLSIKASRAQLQMKSTEKDLLLLKEQHKDNKEEYARKQLEYYREKGINPFSSLLILLIQLPILIGLYLVFLKSGLPVINTEMLYSFVSPPASVNMFFLGLLDISTKSLFLALINPAPKPGDAPQSDMAKAMSTQMKYVFPVLMTFIGYTVSSGIALYLITSNVFAIVQEIYIRKKYHKSTIVV